MRAFILSPHFDDAVIDCYSVLNQTKSTVITIFAGIPNAQTRSLWDWLCGNANSHQMVKARIEENRRALAVTDARIINLDFLDHQYRKPTVAPQLIANQLVNKIPTNTDVYAPLALSRVFRHGDHELVRNAALSLAPNHQLFLYPDIPYMRLGHNADIAANTIVKTAAKTLGIKLEPVIVKLSVSDIENKLRLIKLYETQYRPTNLVSLGGLSRLKRLDYELFFKLVN